MSEFPEPNYTFWDGVQRFEVSEVACLWVNTEPSPYASQNPRALDFRRRLQEAWEQDIFIPEVDKSMNNGKLDCRLWYLRKDLIEFAIWNSEQPAFLFPDMRYKSENCKSLDTSQKDTPQKDTPQKDTPQKDTPQKDTPQKDTPEVEELTAEESNIKALVKHEAEIKTLERNIRFIEELADQNEFPRQAIPLGKKKVLMCQFLEKHSKQFSVTKNSFISAWKTASKADRIQIANRNKFRSRASQAK